MIIVTQTQLRNKDTEAIILLRNEIKAGFNTNAIDYFTISAIDETIDKCNNLSNENNYIMTYLLRGDILANDLSSAKCSNTAYGAKPSRTSNNNK